MKRLGIVLGLLLIAAPVQAQRFTATHAAVSVGASTTAVLAASNTRTFIMLQGDHATNPIYCKFGASAVMNEGFRVNPAGGTLIFDVKWSTQALNCIATGASVLLVTTGAQ